MKKTNFFIVGAAKAGTTSIFNLLKQHPEVFMSPIKEPYFFCKDIVLNDFRYSYREKQKIDIDTYLTTKPLKEIHSANLSDKSESLYNQLFSEATNENILGEGSVGYLYSKVAAEEIFKYNPKSKILIMLREPVERTISHYLMDFTTHNSFDAYEVIKKDFSLTKKGWGISNLYIELSLYYEQIKRYFEVFPKEQILVLSINDLKRNAEMTLKKVFNFLEIDDSVSIEFHKEYNVSRIPSNKFIGKLFSIGLKLPSFIRHPFGKLTKFITKTHKEVEISDECKSYIRGLVEQDWKKTLQFLESKDIHLTLY